MSGEIQKQTENTEVKLAPKEVALTNLDARTARVSPSLETAKDALKAAAKTGQDKVNGFISKFADGLAAHAKETAALVDTTRQNLQNAVGFPSKDSPTPEQVLLNVGDKTAAAVQAVQKGMQGFFGQLRTWSDFNAITKEGSKKIWTDSRSEVLKKPQ